MGREQEIEKKFTEYLDRILAGEEIKDDPAMDDELRAALDFACKIADLRQEPSAQFQARLKASLLQKLEEREAQKKAARGGFWDVFRSHPAWQGAVVVLLVVIALTIVWRAGVFQTEVYAPEKTTASSTAAATTSAPIVKTTAPAATTSVPKTTKPAPAATTVQAADKGLGGTLVSIDAKADKASYKSGETVQIELNMKNITGRQLIVTDFPPIMSVMQEETKQPVYTFTAGKAAYTLEADGTARYTYTWNQVDFKGQPVTGNYYIELEDLEYNGIPIQLILNNPVRFKIY